MSKLLQAEQICKSYRDGNNVTPVLHGVDLSLERGEMLAIVGSSGSGKSTLLHILGTLDSADSGTMQLLGQDVASLSVAQKARLRNEKLGFIYQFHHLLPEFHALDNVAMALRIGGENKQVAREKSAVLLKQFGLEHRLNHRPAELSGGERQRVAIARAMVTNPKAILADEPTGNLDQETADQVFESLIHSKAANKSALIIVTHSMELARKCSRVLRLEKGELKAE